MSIDALVFPERGTVKSKRSNVLRSNIAAFIEYKKQQTIDSGAAANRK